MPAKRKWPTNVNLLIREWGTKLTDKELVEKIKQITGRTYSVTALTKQRQRLKVIKEQGPALYYKKGKLDNLDNTPNVPEK